MVVRHANHYTTQVLHLLKSSSEISAQGQVFDSKLRKQRCSSAERLIFHRKLGNKGCSFTRDKQVRQLLVAFRTLSLVSEQILKDLKDPRGPSVEVRMDLANWALRTSPKFTTGVKYQFHQGFFLPNQRSGNPNQPSPPSFKIVIDIFVFGFY